MIAPGCIVRVYRHGDVAWVVEHQQPDDKWRVVSKAVDHRGLAVFSGRTVGPNEMVLVRDAPIYRAGTTVERDGLSYTVDADLGDHVELIVPNTRFPLRGGGALHVPGGNTTTVAKSDLTLEALK